MLNYVKEQVERKKPLIDFRDIQEIIDVKKLFQKKLFSSQKTRKEA